LLSYFLEKKQYHYSLVFSTIVVVVGAVTTVFKNPEFNIIGFGAALTSAVLAGVTAVVSALLLQRAELTVIDVALTTSLPSLISIAPIFWITEYQRLLNYQAKDSSFTTVLVISVSLFAFFYTLSSYLLIQLTSSQYSQIIGNVKSVLVVCVSIIVFQTPFTSLNLFGMILTLAGFFSYSYFHYSLSSGSNHHPKLQKEENDDQVHYSKLQQKENNNGTTSKTTVSKVKEIIELLPLSSNTQKKV